MILTIAPGSIAARVPITPGDSIVVTLGDSGYACFVNYTAGSAEIQRPRGHFAGMARLVCGPVLPKAFAGKRKFSAVALSSGNGVEVPLRLIKPVKPRCAVCGKPISKIGSARANGANHADWAGRSLHKKCWKAMG